MRPVPTQLGASSDAAIVRRTNRPSGLQDFQSFLQAHLESCCEGHGRQQLDIRKNLMLLNGLRFLQAVWTGLHVVCLLMVARFDMYSQLSVHLIFVGCTYCFGTLWLLTDTVIEWRLACLGESPARTRSALGELLGATRRRTGKDVAYMLLIWPVWVMDALVELGAISTNIVLHCLTGYSGSLRFPFWLCWRGMGLLGGGAILAALGLGSTCAMLSSANIMAIMQAHCWDGTVPSDDSDFPIWVLNLCAFVEWAALVGLPGVLLLSFWDAFGTATSEEILRSRRPVGEEAVDGETW
eukprot:CAMPEP_0206531272 /NCGR_PEP_ID=MMETSP0325_2-20121206/3665_1 /ASSEMBLY_ACC=CAM_ASM_000347 /TAXON_ID=2866 /ORGANISM="Crypthecodinium cohnii, Strain Seligo" /LENGTH=295 /DNA_ID=CAMNT_0054027481 /DNA_START=303 /DNA_END=1187 /DNA_ORIENTATION=+